MYVGNASALGRLGTAASAAPRQYPAQLAGIPPGIEGTKATLTVMRDYARASIRDHRQIVRQKADDLTRNLPPRARAAQVYALHDFVRDRIRYQNDPVGVERVARPEVTLDVGQGDCDDKATLLAALLESIGHPARFVALAFDGEGFSHVLVETPMGQGGWMPLETIIDVPAGWYPENVTARYVRKV